MSTVDKPQDNQLLAKQLEEAKEISVFLHSPVWVWLKQRLEDVRPRLMVYATAPGKDRDDRMLTLGKLALVEEILSRPAILSDLKRRYDSAIEAEAPVYERMPKGSPIREPGML